MNCEWAKANVTLYVYDELPDDERYEFEQHTQRCPACAAELKAVRGLKEFMSAAPALEPAPNLLTSSRLHLQEALETAEQHQGWRRLILEPSNWLRQIRLAPAAAALLFIVGFGAGIGTTYRIVGGSRTVTVARTSAAAVPGSAAQQPTEAAIAAITGIDQQPGSNSVDIRYETVVPQRVQGSIDDPRIQQLLLFATRKNNNSGVRLNSVDLLTQKPEDEQIRQALMFALRYDSNAGVRQKALKGLGTYVKGDMRVRDAVLEALISDSDPDVRNEAIQMIKSARADSSVRQVLKHLANSDQNTAIRDMSRSVLASTPQID
jgi:hypothetical protein